MGVNVNSTKRTLEDDNIEKTNKIPKIIANQSDLEKTRQVFEELKTAFNTPKIYLTNYFDDLRNEVDIECTRLLQELHDDLTNAKSIRVLKDQASFINEFKSLETKCLTKLESDEMNIDSRKHFSEVIDKLDTDLKDSLDELDLIVAQELIYETLFELQKLIFDNQSIIYMTESHYNNLSSNRGSDEVSYGRSFSNESRSIGKLIAIQDEFITKKRMHHKADTFENREQKINWFSREDLIVLFCEETIPKNTTNSIEAIRINAHEKIEFNLSKMKINKIKQDLFDSYPELREINLGGNILTTLESHNFNGLSNLTVLNLSYNKLTSLKANTFQALTSLKKLSIAFNDLTTLEPKLFHTLHCLEELNFNANKLTTIDSGLFQNNKKLTVLSLSSNQIDFLEKSIFNGLTKLKELLLQRNKLKNLNEDLFKGLGDLETVDISGNDLTELVPSLLIDLKNLIDFDASQNEIETIDIGLFKDLNRLETISLEQNRLISLDPRIFESCENLITLDLSQNRLSLLDSQVFMGLNCIEDLNLDDNRLMKLDLGILKYMPELKEVHLENNFLKKQVVKEFESKILNNNYDSDDLDDTFELDESLGENGSDDESEGSDDSESEESGSDVESENDVE